MLSKKEYEELVLDREVLVARTYTQTAQKKSTDASVDFIF